MPNAKKAVTAEVSSGNVFADLGLPNAEELNTKLRLCFVINRILADRKLTQAEAARILGVNQPKVSALKSYKLEGFSVERLMSFATALEHDVVIEIRPRRKAAGAARVLVVGAA
ncbi:MAG: helix-turn-helix transcriptional regulator [Acidobacteriaceae bacterium]|jgi:predicted XRE-type DNA-binding protein